MLLRIAAIIPAYNEEFSIENVVKEIHAVSQKCRLQITPIVVNDCSGDKTGVVAENLDCITLHLPVNVGIGSAVQTGFIFAYENNYDYAVQVDGDGQHPPEYIPILLEEMLQKNLDVVIGSRYVNKKGFQSSLARRTGIRYFHWLNKLLTGLEISDSTSGFRMINRKVLKVFKEYYPDEYPEPEAIVLYSKNKFRVSEVAVEMRERQAGKSSIDSFGSLYYMLKVTLAIIFTFARSVKAYKRILD